MEILKIELFRKKPIAHQVRISEEEAYLIGFAIRGLHKSAALNGMTEIEKGSAELLKTIDEMQNCY